MTTETMTTKTKSEQIDQIVTSLCPSGRPHHWLLPPSRLLVLSIDRLAPVPGVCSLCGARRVFTNVGLDRPLRSELTETGELMPYSHGRAMSKSRW